MKRQHVIILAGTATAAILALDAYLYVDGVDGNTITQLSKAAPAALPFAAGFACGHLFA